MDTYHCVLNAIYIFRDIGHPYARAEGREWRAVNLMLYFTASFEKMPLWFTLQLRPDNGGPHYFDLSNETPGSC